MMSEKNEVFEIIKSVITSQKGGVLLKDLNRDYRNLAGENIPYKSLGYQSIEDILHDIPEIFSSVDNDGNLVFKNRGKNCEHLIKLVSKQKSGKFNKSKQPNKRFVPNPHIPRPSMVGEAVHQKPRKFIKDENSIKLHSDDLPESSSSERIATEKYELALENDNDTVCMMKKSVGNRTKLEEKYTNNAEKIYNFNLKQKNGAHPRKNEAHFNTDFSGERARSWKPQEVQCDGSSWLQHLQDGSHDPSLFQDDRIYLYKFSNQLDPSEATYHGYRYKYDEINCGIANWYSPTGISIKPKSFRASRAHLMEDYPHPLYRDEGFDRPGARHLCKYSKNPKYGSYGVWDSRYVPEINDWDTDEYLSHRCSDRSEMEGSSWQKSYDACEHSGRKIDLIGGSLKVTIKNY